MRKRMGSSPFICTTGSVATCSVISTYESYRRYSVPSFGVRVEVKVLLWLVVATARFLIRFLLAVVSYTVHIV